MDETSSSYCPWCSAEIAAGAPACPKCGALVEGAQAAELPGLTEVDTQASPPDEPTIPDSVNPLSWFSAGSEAPTLDPPAEDTALEPPTEAVELEMRKMELEAEIINAGTDVMGPGEETITVGPPSIEALEAYEAGLLDKEGPAGENMDAEAQPWEDPELEARLAEWRAQNPE
jgi:hypothetical protein